MLFTVSAVTLSSSRGDKLIIGRERATHRRYIY